MEAKFICKKLSMKLILLSYPTFFKREVELVTHWMQNYSFVYHLRKPEATDGGYERFLNEIPERFHPRIVLHGAYQLQQNYAVGGIHFSTKNRTEYVDVTARGTKSTSCHSVGEVKNLDGAYDYVFLSPIFESISKQGYVGSLNADEVRTYLSESRKSQVIALGGIDEKSISKLQPFGFEGMAVLGGVWTANPIQNIAQLNSNFEKIYQCL